VHGLQAPDRLNKNLPDLPFLDVRFDLFVVTNFLKYVAVVSQFHYDAKTD